MKTGCCFQSHCFLSSNQNSSLLSVRSHSSWNLDLIWNACVVFWGESLAFGSSRGSLPHREASPESKPGQPSGDIWLNSKKWWGGGGSALSPVVSCCVKASQQNPHSKPIYFPASLGMRLLGSRVAGGSTVYGSNAALTAESCMTDELQKQQKRQLIRDMVSSCWRMNIFVS